MSDTRFASLKTDPRFRRPKKHHSKVVLDDRFQHLLGDAKKYKKKKERTRQTTGAYSIQYAIDCSFTVDPYPYHRSFSIPPRNTTPTPARVDKYGRTVSETQEKDDLRRFYRLETEEGGEDEAVPTIVDYARGAALMESSDEDEEDGDLPPRVSLTDGSGSDSDQGGFVSLGAKSKKRHEDEEDEIDLDENTIAALDAQVAEYAKTIPDREEAADVQQTRRLAVVNLDWDYVRAAHLFKIFSSHVSPTASETAGKNKATRGRLLSVRVYPSEFGKKRMTREEKEGPPTDVFRKKKKGREDEEINEKTIYETGDEADYDEDALRKYQLERLRYYYAIVECDTVAAALHVYNELEGTELERSANIFDLSFVPDDMTFDDEPRDEATQLSNAPYRAVEFVTDALRHSKVKLTWDDDDPERNHILRRSLTKKEIEEADFRAYIAPSSSSSAESEDEGGDAGTRQTKSERKSSKGAERDRLRTLLLGGNDDELPEGWGDAFDNKASRREKTKSGGGEDSDVDMEVTFTPGLTETRNPEDENTLERYQRKTKEKRKKKKEESRKQAEDDGVSTKKESPESNFDDEFFGVESGSQHEEEEETSPNQSSNMATELKRPAETSKAELALLATSDNPHGEPAHFDMKAVLKADKRAKKMKSRHKSKKRDKNDVDDGPGETQDDFVIDVHDDRFAAVHEDHQFAIDPTHPQFKKSKSMATFLNERSRRQKSNPQSRSERSQSSTQQNSRTLQSLVESVKRKSSTVDHSGLGKRRKLGKS
ncbi:hypothetical protein JVT61DRAFT_8853 [Boletus reticuloceps]|uniref:NUC153 domain-containing protein n=1 Tax=Boletus reticuloceps TaxID=495285 RepID=A0A8I3A649_9AGAM|nr:hypothetical protein JVT61DRAFT_8853 [Boletus reticuloceps]